MTPTCTPCSITHEIDNTTTSSSSSSRSIVVVIIPAETETLLIVRSDVMYWRLIFEKDQILNNTLRNTTTQFSINCVMVQTLILFLSPCASLYPSPDPPTLPPLLLPLSSLLLLRGPALSLSALVSSVKEKLIGGKNRRKELVGKLNPSQTFYFSATTCHRKVRFPPSFLSLSLSHSLLCPFFLCDLPISLSLSLSFTPPLSHHHPLYIT